MAKKINEETLEEWYDDHNALAHHTPDGGPVADQECDRETLPGSDTEDNGGEKSADDFDDELKKLDRSAEMFKASALAKSIESKVNKLLANETPEEDVSKEKDKIKKMAKMLLDVLNGVREKDSGETGGTDKTPEGND